ncbi:MAG TPA: hypothetical protein VHB73_06900 [Alphaproteobacteria bacterium]|nr:hypothetical protein [Alphaproteobacteria bacterium]
MSVSGVGGTGGGYGYSVSAVKDKAQNTIDQFLNFAKQTPAERLQEAWLKSHGYTKEKLAAMTPEQRDAVAKQMARDIAQQTKEAAENRTKTKVNIIV